MGQSTDAILCWGIEVTEDDEGVPWDEAAEEAGFDEGGADEEYLALVLCGLAPYRGDNDAALREYWKAKREALKACDIELVRHCSYDYPMYVLAIAASKVKANRGYPQTITKAHIDQAEADTWQAKLTDACEKLGVEPQSGQWILCSMLG
jgi:hypothetical protein